MRVLFVAGRELTYARNDVLLRALRRCAQVDTIAPPAPPASLAAASSIVATQAAARLARGRYDLVVVGFYGSLILPLLRPLTRAPILFDAFVSNYDTLAFDRGAFAPDSARGRLALALDRIPCALADHVLLDTHAHVDYFVDTLGIARHKLEALPVGCSEELFHPAPQPATALGTVLYYCTYLPLHGVETVLYAASYLQAQAVQFRLIGDGPLRPAMEALAHALRLRNTTFLPSMPAPQIAHELRQADICLGGHFGPSAKAQRTIPGKLYQMLAAQRVVIAADSPANRELLVHNESAWLLPPQDPPALALAIMALQRDAALRARMAAGGRRAYVSHASEAVIAARVRSMVSRLVPDAGLDARDAPENSLTHRST